MHYREDLLYNATRDYDIAFQIGPRANQMVRLETINRRKFPILQSNTTLLTFVLRPDNK